MIFRVFSLVLIGVGSTVLLSACMPLQRKAEPTFNERLLQDQQKKIAAGEDPNRDTSANPSSDPNAASLWARSEGNPYLVRNQKAQKVGDLLTILISESSSATTQAKTNTKRDSKMNLTGTANWGQADPEDVASLGISTGNKNDFKGEGTTDRSGNFQATVQAVVENVLENGTLYVRGKKTITINNEDQDVEITGFVRPDDIRINNTVISTVMADAKIRYLGDGVISDKQRAGWAARLVDVIWPF